MKIAMVTEFLAPKGKPRLGGVDSRTVSLARNMVDDHEVHILAAFMSETNREEDYDGITIHRIGDKRIWTQKNDFLKRYKFNSEIKLSISKLRPDIVDASGFVSYAGSFEAARRINVPVVATVHEVWQNDWVKNMGFINGLVGSYLEKRYLKYAFNKYISVSDFTKTKLIENIGVPEGKISVIGNGVDLSLFDSIDVRSKYPSITIITVCRLVPYKRVDDIIKAVKILSIDITDIKLIIIGDGPEEPKLKRLVNTLGLNENVDFLGKVNEYTELIKLLKKSHIFVLASVTEGFGIVVIEAMAAGIPYVAPDIPPIREITLGGTGGLLFKPKDPKDLALKIRISLDNDISVQKNKIDKLISKYDWRDIAKETEDCYKCLINSRTNR